ncbi:MAG: type II toxin-antitoxin system VapC family toxin [Actinobacteria bacterium]|nr:type II toxin-antitoxin system VapC family toxin [Actinomycetota bacterium]
MAALVDTSILIDHLRGHGPARDLLQGQIDHDEPLFASVLSKAEVLAGLRRGEEPATRSLLGLLVLVEVSDAIAERAGAYARRYLRSHPGVDLVDYVIAATSAELDVPVWTMNVRHFPMFPRLQRPY